LEAHELITTAEEQVKSLQNRADEIEADIRGLEHDQKEAKLKLDDTFEAIDNKKVEIKKLETEIKQKQEQLKTLESARDAFKGIV
jgi:chromosome segregation ATPase